VSLVLHYPHYTNDERDSGSSDKEIKIGVMTSAAKRELQHVTSGESFEEAQRRCPEAQEFAEKARLNCIAKERAYIADT